MKDLKNILFCVRDDLITKMGGDTIQILKTREFLKRYNVRVDITYHSDIDFRNYDLAHLFNLETIHSTYNFSSILTNLKIPYVLSPIYWDSSEYRNKVLRKINFKNRFAYLILKNKFIENIFNKTIRNKSYSADSEYKRRFCLENARGILPNSFDEQRVLEKKFYIFNNYYIIPNAIDTNIEPENYDQLKQRFSLPDDFILCVGRIEFRKNQIMVLQAAKEIGIKILLVGAINAAEIKYWKTIRKRFKNDFIHIQHLKHNEIFVLYQKAKAHVLASWFETPGLASLEAAYNGCQIISTDRGCTYEYFGNFAYYCSPGNYTSIRSAIINALQRPKDIYKFKEIVLKNFTWEKAAELTFKAYKEALSNK